MTEMICGYEVHPACGILPLMPAAALEEMAEDIKAHGQQQPVFLYDGKVLDGRNRLKACQLAGVAPKIRDWTGDDPVRWVLSLNFHRRHLTEDQKSVVGARAETLLAQRAALAEAALTEAADGVAVAAAVSAGPTEVTALTPAPVAAEITPSAAIERRARQTAAALVNVSPRRIARGRKLLDQAVPALVSAVERGAVSMSQAQRVATLERDAQSTLMAQGAEAVIDEARRLQQARQARRPSLARALSDIDISCSEWTLSRSREGGYAVVGTTDAGALDVGGDDLKGAVMAAWSALEPEAQ